jgi:ABC-type lipoprotein release transport system permease subunit
LEGSLAAFFSIFAALFLGYWIFSWFQSVGLDISHLSESSMPVSERILLEIRFMEVAMTALVVVTIMVLVSWAPVRKISRLDPTLALRGKGIT